jgi:hypothetical protein
MGQGEAGGAPAPDESRARTENHPAPLRSRSVRPRAARRGSETRPPSAAGSAFLAPSAGRAMRLRGPRRARIDIDDVGGFEHDARAIVVHRADMRRLRKIRRSAGGELGMELDRRHPADPQERKSSGGQVADFAQCS